MKSIIIYLSLFLFSIGAALGQVIDTTIVLTPKEALHYFMQEYGPRPRSFINPITHKEVWVVDLHYVNTTAVFIQVDTIINGINKRVIKKSK